MTYRDREKKNAWFRAWRKKNPEKMRELNRKYDAAKRARKIASAPRPLPAACEICAHERPLHFDHDHATGVFRGWICGNCNRALGLIHDDPSTARQLAAYLERCKC